MAVSQSATYDGQPVTVHDTETHRSDTMLYVEFERGAFAGARRWVFADDVTEGGA